MNEYLGVTTEDVTKPASEARNPYKIHVEYAVRLAPGVGMIFGWMVDPTQKVTQIRLSGSLGTVVLTPDAFAWYSRADIAKHFKVDSADDNYGFMAWVPLKQSSEYAFEAVDDSGGKQVQIVEFHSLDNFIPQFAQAWPYLNATFMDLILRRAQKWPVELLGDKGIDPGTLPKFFNGAVDYVFLLDEEGILFNGWIIDPFHQIKSLVVVNDKTGEFLDVTEQLIRVPRHDVGPVAEPFGVSADKLGFLSYLHSASMAVAGTTSYTLVVVLDNGSLIQYRMLVRKFMPTVENVKLILNFFPDYHADIADIMGEHVGPFLKEAWRHRKLPDPKVKATVLGTLPEKPRVSVIVPIYGRYDFIHYQLALFANDSDFKQNAELIYVIDDPRIYEPALKKCKALYQIFEVPFRVVYGGANFGYARANNIGAGFAHGDLLLLLNSDVMPKQAGWLKVLADIYDALERPGAIAPKLLYEDGSIQHAGIGFINDSSVWGNFWINDHPLKGQPNWPVEHTEPRAIGAVTGACLMIDKQLYFQSGGLDESYILGDFEDTDLCLKLGSQGYTNYYIPELELYHLERQSQSLVESHNGWKTKLSMFNCWQHHIKWNDTIAKLTV